MENLSRSRQPNKALPALPKKACNGVSYGSAKATTYDDVFGGPPKFGPPALSPRLEDYGEIFGGFHASRASSIPVLDLPLVEEEEVFFDVRSSGFDYGDVFGGFQGLDAAASYEELLMDQSKGGVGDSSDDAWSPVEIESPFGGSDHSGKSQFLTTDESCESIPGSTEFSISYNRSGQRSNTSNVIAQITELRPVPGYTFAIDEVTSIAKEFEDQPMWVTSDTSLGSDYSGEIMKRTHPKKPVSHQETGNAEGLIDENENKPQRTRHTKGYLPNEVFVSVSEISLKTHPSALPPPSRPPPALDAKSADSSRSTSHCRTSASEGSLGDSSPLFFDVEIDARSDAAASAAAMKDAMEKAQSQLRSAKESRARKKGGTQSHVNPGSKNGIKDNEAKARTHDGSCGIQDERAQVTSEQDSHVMELSVLEEREISNMPVLGSLGADRTLNIARKSSESKLESKSQSRQGLAEDDEWKEAAQFFELVRADKSKSIFEVTSNEECLEHNIELPEHGQKERKAVMEVKERKAVMEVKEKKTVMEAYSKQQEKEVNAITENYKLEDIANETCGRKENRKSEAAKEAHRRKRHEKKVKAAQEVRAEIEKKFGMPKTPTVADHTEKLQNLVNDHKKNELQQNEVNGGIQNQDRIKESRARKVNEKVQADVLEWEGIEKKLTEALGQAEDERMLKEMLEQELKKKMRKEVLHQKEDEEKEKVAHKREVNEKGIGAQEQMENGKHLKKTCEQIQIEKGQQEINVQVQNGRRLKEAHILTENQQTLTDALKQEEKERSLQAACVQEENEKRLNEAYEQGEVKNKQREVCKGEEIGLRLEGALQPTEVEIKQTWDSEEVDIVKKHIKTSEKEDIEKRLGRLVATKKIDDQSKDRKLRFIEIIEKVESRSPSEDTYTREENQEKHEGGLNKVQEFTETAQIKKVLQTREGIHSEEENHLRVNDEACKVDACEKIQVTPLAENKVENFEKLEKSLKVSVPEENGIMQPDLILNQMKSEAIEMKNVRLGPESVLSDKFQGAIGLEQNLSGKVADTESFHQENKVKRGGCPGNGIEQRSPEQTKVSSQTGSARGSQQEYTYNWEERRKNVKQSQAFQGQEKSKGNFTSTQVLRETSETGRKWEATQTSILKAKGSSQKTTQSVDSSKITEQKDRNLSGTPRPEEREAERIRREREYEKEHIRRVDEEREREREKDRMTVDRLNAEVRDRTERAAVERATAEARYRALAEARERLEKVCAEAKEKSLGDKAINDARLRAERAAVERATAEARERAAEKAAFEARERIERSVSDKFYVSSRNSGMRPSSSSSDLHDQQFQSSSSFGVSRYPYPYASAYGASYPSDKPEGFEGESAQRCKARLERHRRTAERAAKALAEKNMRDLAAQREQAERNRFAEALDADVKRWSSGKEGNLRALLSTLQYILGIDSGWQPVPLTEVITAVAVKKAYRKATLCVHPDKLQQRGASIQQKYICEKVFDLLKEAWNKFNSEER